MRADFGRIQAEKLGTIRKSKACLGEWIMIKGVNRNVIEIVDTDSELFERAILFVRPEGRESDPEYLERSAQGFLAQTKLNRRILRGKSVFGTVLKYVFAASIGAGLAALILFYI